MLITDQFEMSISEVYHENSKYNIAAMQPPNLTTLDLAQSSQSFKIYNRASSITLPEDFPICKMTLEEVITIRRSLREYSGEPIALFDLAKLLFFSCGLTSAQQDDNGSYFFRAAPSAGALYPIEIYPVIFNIKGLDCGVYHYNIRDHALELLRSGDYREALHTYCLFHDFVLTANVLLLSAAVFPRVKAKYGERGYRFSLLEAGHIAQNTCLVATTMNLGSVSIGGFLDDELNSLLGLDGVEEAVVYATAIGVPTRSTDK